MVLAWCFARGIAIGTHIGIAIRNAACLLWLLLLALALILLYWHGGQYSKTCVGTTDEMGLVIKKTLRVGVALAIG
eukprot:516232-Lingulodinium_polyedra.AAC.1